MSVIIRLQGLPWSASALDIRNFFSGLQIPAGGVHIIGGDKGDAFIAFSTDEDARQGMMKTFQSLNGSPVQLLLSSKTEMQNVIDAARTGQAVDQPVEPTPKALPVEQPKPYEDPYNRGPPVQDARGGYRDEFQDPSQAMFGGEQVGGYREEPQNQPPWNDAGYTPDNRAQFGVGRDMPREGFQRDGIPKDGFRPDVPPVRDGFRGDGPPPRDGFRGDGPPPRDGFRGDGPPPRDGFRGDGPPPRDGFRGDGPQREGFRGDGPPPRDVFRGDMPPRDDFQRPRPNNDWFQRDGPPRDGPPRDGPPRDGPPRDGPPRDGPPRDGPPRDGPPRDGPPRDGPPMGMRNINIPGDRIQEPFPTNAAPDQYGAPPFDRAPVGEPPFNRNQGPPPFGGITETPADVRQPQDIRRPDQRGGEFRRGAEGRSEGRNGRDRDAREGREGREGRERESKDGKEGRDRRDRSDRDRTDRDRSDRDRSSRSDRDRSSRSDRSDRRSDRSERDKDRRDHSESRRSDSKETRESKDRPTSADKPSSDSRHSRESSSRSETRGPPGRTRADFMGAARPFSEPSNQFPPNDPRNRPADGSFPSRDTDRPRTSRFDKERPPVDLQPGRLGGDDRRLPQDPDLRIPPDGVRGPPDGPRGPMDGPRGPMDGPRGPMDGPRGPMDGPRRAHDGPRGPFDAPRGPMDGPRGPMDGPRGSMDGPRGPMDGPRGPMDGPRGPMDGPRGPMDGPRGPMDGPRGPMDGPRGPMDGPRGPMDGPRGMMDGPRGPMDGPRGPMDGPRDGYRGPMDDPRGQVDGPRDGFRGPMDGSRGRGPPMFPDQGNGFDRDSRPPDRDFRGGPPGEGGFHQRQPMGRGRPGEGGPPGPRGMRDEGFQRGPDEGRSMNGPWDMERFPGGPPGRPAPRQDFGEARPGPGPVSKGLLGDAPGMLPPARGMLDRADVQMDHDGREAKLRNYPPDRPGPGPFGRPGEMQDFGRGTGDEMQRFKGRDMDPRSNRDAPERGPRPMGPDERGPRQMMPDDRRRGDWGGSDGGRDGPWPEERGPPRGRPVDRDEGPYSHRGRPPHMSEQSRKRARQPEEGNVYLRLQNLPFNVSYSMVRRFFTGCDIPYDGLKLLNDEQGKRNGTAFVRFMTEDSCYNGLKRNGYDMIGRNVVVSRCNVAEFDSAVDSFVPDEDEDDGADPPKRARSDAPQEADKLKSDFKPMSFSQDLVVKVSNLPLNASLEEIRNQMTTVEIAGHGSALAMEYDPKGSFTGVAYVEVVNADNYQRALGIEGKHMGSRILRASGSSKADLNRCKSTQTKVDSTSSKLQKTPDKKVTDNESAQGDGGEFAFYCVVLTGLPPESSYREVREFFSGLDIVQRGIQVSHDGSGNPTGDAYVEFSTKKDCKDALKRDEQMMLQNKVTVKPILKNDLIQNLRNARSIISTPAAPAPVNQNAGITKPIPPGVLKRQWVYLRCSNLPLQVTIRELLAFFHKYNPVPESIRLHYTGDGNPTGNAVVGFPTKGEAAKAMTDLNGTMCRRNNVVIANA